MCRGECAGVSTKCLTLVHRSPGGDTRLNFAVTMVIAGLSFSASMYQNCRRLVHSKLHGVCVSMCVCRAY